MLTSEYKFKNVLNQTQTDQGAFLKSAERTFIVREQDFSRRNAEMCSGFSEHV
jgi:hypothetical protein